jgi:hypothetical protein
MARSALDNIPPGPKLDALTAEKVFGWQKVHKHQGALVEKNFHTTLEGITVRAGLNITMNDRPSAKPKFNNTGEPCRASRVEINC